MSDSLFELVASYGSLAVLIVTFLSCLALPVPSSLVMLAGGAFVASGDLGAVPVALGAWMGAVAGDQTGFGIGRWGRNELLDRIGRRHSVAATIHRAEALIARWGTVSVFLSRWLFSPLGPYVNFIGGAAGMGWPAFTLGSVTGEAVWVAIYVGLGYGFAGQIAALGELLGNAAGVVTGAAITVLLGVLAFRRRHPHA